MAEILPSVLLVAMIILTIILLPYLNDEPPRPGERSGGTEELHIKRQDRDA